MPATPPRLVAAPTTGPALAIAAHPDDVERWCGGALALMAAAGAEVRLLLVTSGDRGSNDPAATREGVAALREREAIAAAAALGVAGVEFLRHGDGEVVADCALRGAIVAAIRRWRPAVVFTHDPETPLPRYTAHRDHRATGRATLDAVYPDARDHLAYPEHHALGLQPHAVREVWLFASAAADRVVDVAPVWERRIAARLLHTSQTPDPAALPASWRAMHRVADDGPALGEAFTVIAFD